MSDPIDFIYSKQRISYRSRGRPRKEFDSRAKNQLDGQLNDSDPFSSPDRPWYDGAVDFGNNFLNGLGIQP